MPESSVLTSPFPQSGLIPTRDETIAELASYTGGEESAQVKSRAGRSYDAAVRAFNSVWWKFNRMADDITLSSGHSFSLNDDFGAPMRACMVDTSDNETTPVTWMEWGHFENAVKPRTGTGTMPELYTCRNSHETGLVTVWPTLGSTLTYPTMRVYYFRRIVKASGAGDRLNVPEEVYQAIFQLALAMSIAKTESGAKAAVSDYALAASMRLGVEQQHRDYQDYT